MADRIPVIAGEVARRIGARLPDLTPEMTTMFVDIIPEFRHDQAVQRLRAWPCADGTSRLLPVSAPTMPTRSCAR